MSELTIQQAMELAIARQRAGKLTEAETIYRNILARHPDLADAYANLGIVLRRLRRPAEAEAACRRAVELRPLFFEALLNLGNICQDQGKFDEAISAFEKARAARPDSADACFNLGNALSLGGKTGEAIGMFRQALQIRPAHAEAFNAIGAALGATFDSDPAARSQAIAAFRDAVAIRGDFAEAMFNLGQALWRKAAAESPDGADQADWIGAMEAFGRTIALRPAWAHAHSAMANVQCARRDWPAAIAAARQALVLNPDLAEAHFALGAGLAAQNELEAAIAALRRATAIKPDFMNAFNRLGAALREIGDADGSEDYLKRAAALPNADSAIHNNLSVTYKYTGRIEEAVAAGERAMAADPGNALADSNRVYAIWFHPGYNAAAILREHRVWSGRHAEGLRKFIRPHENNRSAEKRLRVGYVSPDFREHVVGRNILPLIERHDRDQFEVYCYSNSEYSDATTERFKSSAHAWRGICRVTDADAEAMIRADGIDILVDLSLHMAGNRLTLFARKPAPVQVTFAGYPGTTGLETIDWRLTDPHLDAVETDGDYSERSFRLPDSFWCFEDSDPGNKIASHLGKVLTFGCLNNFCKVTGAMLELWSRVLRAVPGSRMVMLAPAGRTRRGIVEKMKQHGVEESRLEFASYQRREAYLAEMGRIDICLDTIPYNGHATSLDAFWMGVPVLTLVGGTVVGRAGLSQLTNLDLRELAARDDEQFVRIAAELAGDRRRLAEMRRTLRDRMMASPLMDAPRWTRGIEGAYRKIWQANLP